MIQLSTSNATAIVAAAHVVGGYLCGRGLRMVFFTCKEAWSQR